MAKKGRPFEPGNKFGRGRPRGSRNKKTLLAQELLDSHGDAVVRKALMVGLRGDAAMLRCLLDHLLPRRRDLPVKTGPLPMGTAEELSQTSELVLKKVASGQLTVSAAREIFALMEARRQVIETRDFESQLRAIEKHLQGQPGGDPADHLAPYTV